MLGALYSIVFVAILRLAASSNPNRHEYVNWPAPGEYAPGKDDYRDPLCVGATYPNGSHGCLLLSGASNIVIKLVDKDDSTKESASCFSSSK